MGHPKNFTLKVVWEGASSSDAEMIIERVVEYFEKRCLGYTLVDASLEEIMGVPSSTQIKITLSSGDSGMTSYLFEDWLTSKATKYQAPAANGLQDLMIHRFLDKIKFFK